MNDLEVRIVKRQLESYLDLKKLANEKDKEAILLQTLYESVAGAQAIKLEPRIGCGDGSGSSRESRLNEILTELQHAEEDAQKYRSEAVMIESFVMSLDDSKRYLERIYLNGESCSDVAADLPVTRTAVNYAVMAVLSNAQAKTARYYGLL